MLKLDFISVLVESDDENVFDTIKSRAASRARIPTDIVSTTSSGDGEIEATQEIVATQEKPEVEPEKENEEPEEVENTKENDDNTDSDEGDADPNDDVNLSNKAAF